MLTDNDEMAAPRPHPRDALRAALPAVLNPYGAQYPQLRAVSDAVVSAPWQAMHHLALPELSSALDAAHGRGDKAAFQAFLGLFVRLVFSVPRVALLPAPADTPLAMEVFVPLVYRFEVAYLGLAAGALRNGAPPAQLAHVMWLIRVGDEARRLQSIPTVACLAWQHRFARYMGDLLARISDIGMPAAAIADRQQLAATFHQIANDLAQQLGTVPPLRSFEPDMKHYVHYTRLLLERTRAYVTVAELFARRMPITHAVAGLARVILAIRPGLAPEWAARVDDLQAWLLRIPRRPTYGLRIATALLPRLADVLPAEQAGRCRAAGILLTEACQGSVPTLPVVGSLAGSAAMQELRAALPPGHPIADLLATLFDDTSHNDEMQHMAFYVRRVLQSTPPEILRRPGVERAFQVLLARIQQHVAGVFQNVCDGTLALPTLGDPGRRSPIARALHALVQLTRLLPELMEPLRAELNAVIDLADNAAEKVPRARRLYQQVQQLAATQTGMTHILLRFATLFVTLL